MSKESFWKNKYFLIFLVLIGIILNLGLPSVGNNEPLIIHDISVLPTVNATTLPIQLQLETISILNISGKIITCTIKGGEHVLDLNIINNDVINRSVTVYPMHILINITSKQNLIKKIAIPTGTNTITLISDKEEQIKLLVPVCNSGGSSGQVYFSSGYEITNYPGTNAPVLTDVPASATIDELVEYSFDANATDADIPAQTLTFSLVGGPTDAAIDPATGVFRWNPTEAQGAGIYPFKVRVSDEVNYTDALITLTVNEVDNTGPSPIPEFPSLALPVMAVLGLLFIMQKRKL